MLLLNILLKENEMIDYILANLPVPDFMLRAGSKYLIGDKAREVNAKLENKLYLEEFAESLKKLPIAIATDKANEQHYEVPDTFYEVVLGEYLKYSCCYWEKASNLDEASRDMLDLYLERAQISSGQTILDLGCGWGSFSLYAAQKFKDCHFTALSNSSTQKSFIEERCRKLGITNLEVITENIATAVLPQNKFDRIVSIEMLEHMKNYQALFEKISGSLKDDGLFFAHIFSHNEGAYHFEVKSSTDWMTKYFFEGGMMPADRLFYHFQDHLEISDHWKLNGYHYQKTARAWLEKTDQNKEQIIKIFEKTYGEKEALKWFRYWRMFFIAVEELWKFNKGEEWIVSHYLFKKKSRS